MSQDSPSCGAQMQFPNLFLQSAPSRHYQSKLSQSQSWLELKLTSIHPVACINYYAKGTIYIFVFTLYHIPFRACDSQGLTPKYTINNYCSIEEHSTCALTSLAWMPILISDTWKFSILTSRLVSAVFSLKFYFCLE